MRAEHRTQEVCAAKKWGSRLGSGAPMECSVADPAQWSRVLGSSVLASLSEAGRYEPLRMDVGPFPPTSNPRNSL